MRSCGNARSEQTLLLSRELLEDLRLYLVKVNNERKQERVDAWTRAQEHSR